ncbi:MAG TPA: amino acid permease [Pyrinomonadaceae bacterium]|jgi:APA family basic amino acid/polyamine antiporter
MPETPNRNVTLVRGLGLVAAVSIIIGNVIGTGVFLKARVMTCNVGTPGKVLVVWVVAGLLSLAGALTYAELAAMMPRAGGEYVFMREAYGRGAGFLSGWMQILIAKTGSQASVALIFAASLNDLTGKAVEGVGGFGVQLTAILVILIITLLNCAAVRVSGWVATALTGVKIALVLGVGLGAFVLAQGSWGHFALANAGGACEGVSPGAMFGVAGFGAAMLGALWGYDGWNNLTFVAGEIRNPQRNVPVALIGGTILIMLLYVFINAAYFYALPPTAVASVSANSSVAAEVTNSFMAPFSAYAKALVAGLVAAALMASSVGTLHTSVLTGARVPYAMARDGLFFDRLSKVSEKTRVPARAVLAQGLWACALVLILQRFDKLTDYVVFGSYIFYGLVTASIFVFRRRQPHAERPYKAWGYPVVPALFLLVTGFLLVNTFWAAPTEAVMGLLLIGLGFPVYYLFFRGRPAVAPETYEEEEE